MENLIFSVMRTASLRDNAGLNTGPKQFYRLLRGNQDDSSPSVRGEKGGDVTGQSMLRPALVSHLITCGCRQQLER